MRNALYAMFGEFGGATVATVILCAMCLPLFWIGFAWGLDSVRQPRFGWQRRLRWSWLVSIAVVCAVIMAPVLSVLFAAPSEREPLPFLGRNLWQIVVLMGPPLVVFGILPAVCLGLLTRMVARKLGIWCLKCGYDVRSTVGPTCPECGTTMQRTRNSGDASRSARRQAYRYALRGVLALVALFVVVSAGSVFYDCAITPPKDASLRFCEQCGAIELLPKSSRWGIPLGARRMHSFAASAGCDHHWVSESEFLSGKLSPRLMNAADGGALLFVIPDQADPRAPPIYATLEMPSPQEITVYAGTEMPVSDVFTFRWRKGPGSLSAPDARSARISVTIVDDRYSTQYGYIGAASATATLVTCAPDTASNEVASILGLRPWGGPSTRNARSSFLVLGNTQTGGPQKISRHFPNDSLWNRWAYGQLPSALPPIRARGAQLAVVSAADWPRVQSEDAPWPGITLTKDEWDQFGPDAPTPVLGAGAQRP